MTPEEQKMVLLLRAALARCQNALYAARRKAATKASREKAKKRKGRKVHGKAE